MEEKILKNYGMEALDSSELLTVRGGIGFREIRQLLEIAATIAKAVEEYWEDFARGFEKGWEMI